MYNWTKWVKEVDEGLIVEARACVEIAELEGSVTRAAFWKGRAAGIDYTRKLLIHGDNPTSIPEPSPIPGG